MSLVIHLECSPLQSIMSDDHNTVSYGYGYVSNSHSLMQDIKWIVLCFQYGHTSGFLTIGFFF